MTALAPGYLWLLLLALPLIVLFTIRRRRVAVRVPSLFLWQGLEDDRPSRWRILGRLDRRLLALALLLAALVGLSFGLARVSGERALPRDVVAVVDVSGSMGVVHEGRSRLVAAQEALDGLERGLGLEDRLWVVSAGEHPRVVWGPVGSAVAGRPPWAELLPQEWGTADVSGALQVAWRLLGAGAGRRREAWLLSDGGSGPTPAAPAGIRLERITAPSFAANLRLEGVLRAPDEVSLRLAASVANTGSVALWATPQVLLDGSPLLRMPRRRVPAGARVALPPQTLPRPSGDHAVTIELRLARDAQPLDDALAWRVAPLRRLKVLVHDPARSRYLRAALEGDRRVAATRSPAGGVRYDVLVCTASPPDTWRSVSGGLLALGKGALCRELGLRRVDAARAPQGELRTRAHPLLSAVDLDGLLLPRVPLLRGEGWEAQASLGSRPLLLSRERPERRDVALTFDPAQSDLVFKRAFPLLVANALRWIARDSGGQPEWGPRLAASESQAGPTALAVRAVPPERPDDPRTFWVVFALGFLVLEWGLFHLWGLP